MTHNRNYYRQHFRQLRKSLTQSEQHRASQDLHQQLVQAALLNKARVVACYLANDGEIDLTPTIEYCWQQNIQIALPVLHPFSQGHLLFLNYHHNTLMKANHYGIAEPKLACTDVIPLANIDLILAPLVAFDAEGNRLGMGGGFYDRTLAPINRNSLNTQVVGVAHKCQQADHLPSEHWDIPLAKIITPKQVFSTR
ncbi:5-formyltetrahydrofolate cyclo-ligase [Aestuariibacter sp. AA17]|uniref:5-formyltetrahydrofolate cyclo-ligase n=1 Tax=Fluctibacter corallii TaxID=2984329 RepID=A0ABT3A477_9ALTE|nr:5-formyltetrahydrofolate cyclo-ligase [Aestuariibacter sp. AA17]MCV2883463.1 5-formyltetrahydrofolate cyclo-ligase [Aestuariibacter sp. AA17]